jgi:hypothetical protein
MLTAESDLQIDPVMKDRDVVYPLPYYPEIREFSAILQQKETAVQFQPAMDELIRQAAQGSGRCDTQ